MTIGTITTAGAKGQIVIPQKIRDFLHITPETPLQIILTGHSIAIHPVHHVVRAVDAEHSYVSLLKRTVGSWGTGGEKEEVVRHKEELQASKNRRSLW